MNKKICIIGLGYIGLPTAAMFAKKEYEVIGVDKKLEVVEALQKGRVIINEPFLQELVSEVVAKGYLKVSLTPQEADVFIITVPTPILKDKSSDMSYVISAAETIVPYLKKGNIVVLESTSQVGATEEIVKPILEKSGLKVPEEIALGYCPERVLPGKILKELVSNDRVIGGIDLKSATRIKEIYATFVEGDMYITNARTAEMCKIMENTFRDVNIALSNELAKLCEAAKIDVWEVIRLCNKHPRVNLLSPGPGVGGHCLAVDPWFLVEKFSDLAKLIKISREINDSMPAYVFGLIKGLMGELDNKKITILGITYKPDIDDVRESPILALMHLLEQAGCKVSCVDPFVHKSDIKVEALEVACKESDLLVLGVNHQVFKQLPLKDIKGWMRGNKVLDTRHSINEKDVEEAGLLYYTLGRYEEGM